jgi:hypothetical protein
MHNKALTVAAMRVGNEDRSILSARVREQSANNSGQ